MHRAVSRPRARDLLGCAVCFLLLQGALSDSVLSEPVPGYTAVDVVPGVDVAPSLSLAPFTSMRDAWTTSSRGHPPTANGDFPDHKGHNSRRSTNDVVFFMQNITFPSNPSKGTLIEFGGDPGVFVGIVQPTRGINSGKFVFQAQVSTVWAPFYLTEDGIAYYKDREDKAPHPESAVVITDNFPMDNAQHDILVYITNGGGDSARRSIRVFIDCDEVGVGFASGPIPTDRKWTTGDNNAYLLRPGSNGHNYQSGMKEVWPGGAVGAGPLNIYYNTAADQADLFAPFTPYYFGCTSSCNGIQTARCDSNADCARTLFNASVDTVSAGPDDFTCTCQSGFEGPGETCTDIDECTLYSEEIADECHYMAECDNNNGSFACVCPAGFVGEGSDECFDSAWAVRTVFNVPGLAPGRRALTADEIEEIKYEYALIISADPTLPRNSSLVTGMPVSFGAYRYGDSILEILEENAEGKLTLMALMLNKSDAEATVVRLNDPSFPTDGWINIGTVDDAPNVYRWVAQTTSNPIEVNPSGLQVDSVFFDPACMSSGCWKVQITYTAGTDNMNVIFIPKAVGDDSLSYDFDYTIDDSTWDISPADTFVPTEHPCSGTLDYDPTAGELPASVTSCCIPQFLAMYRPVSTFVSALEAVTGLNARLDTACADSASADPQRNRPVTSSDVPIIAKRGQAVNTTAGVFPRPEAPVPLVPGLGADIFADGVFNGMSESRINHTEVLDAYIGIYRAVLSLDEVELRRLGGQLRGTVGVEHTVDTFVGKTEFSMTGIPFLDPFATQVAIHLEKTSFFSVSTHGVNDYTFLEYINMRLIAIYTQDINFSGLDEASNRTVRTNSSGNANYVQVTFTMGATYSPNPDSGGLIPMDSVRAGRGTFFSTTTLEHLCDMYDEGNDTEGGDNVGLSGYTDEIFAFNQMVQQACGPKSAMCASPTSVPDQFVSFNIPLGFEVFDGQASNNLENNIFVSMVINAKDSSGCTNPGPNSGCDPLQVKTTLEASIPIVAGGINIFCDGVTAKTDLKDVVNADIIVGSAADGNELTRLRIIEDIASTNLASVPSTEIKTDSIEAGLMTLVIKGSSSYFENGVVNTQGYSVELDDLITIHLMTDGVAPSETDAQCAAASAPKSTDCQVRDLLAEPPADNLDANGLDTDGYTLNGAFKFDIDRGQGRAMLEPTTRLLTICPFNPTRPAGGLPLESCITRRDVQSRTYPVRQGAAGPTAMELLAQTDDLVSDSLTNEVTALNSQVSNACTCSEGDDEDHDTAVDECCEAGFMQMILGENDYARDLAVGYVNAIHGSYGLNGRYIRAYWINPGYEWTPTQTAGKSIFSVSQKVYLFALITLDENISRRRMLLATDVDPTKDTGSGAGAAQLSFPVSRTSIMAQAFDVPAEKAVVFNVEMQLTTDEACMSDDKFVEAARSTFEDYVDTAASAFHSVQVLGFTRNLNGVACRRALRKMLAEFSDATAEVQMMIVYKDEAEAVFNDAAFAGMAGINSVTADPSTAANVKVDPTYTNSVPNSSTTPSSSESSSNNTAMIAGIAGGIGGAVLLLAGALLLMRSRRSEEPMATAVQTIDVRDLKAQLSDDA